MPISQRKFYKTTITFVVLSEEPLGDFDLEQVLRDCDTGPCVGELTDSREEELDGAQMAKALEAARSDSGFFCLTPDGEDENEEDA